MVPDTSQRTLAGIIRDLEDVFKVLDITATEDDSQRCEVVLMYESFMSQRDILMQELKDHICALAQYDPYIV